MTTITLSTHLGQARRPSSATYLRRRLLVGLVLATLVLTIVSLTSHVLADRGDVPASIPAIRPAAAPTAGPGVATGVFSVAGETYIVRAGDTLWAIAEAHHGRRNVSDYVEVLVDLNGGTTLDIGQQLVLP